MDKTTRTHDAIRAAILLRAKAQVCVDALTGKFGVPWNTSVEETAGEIRAFSDLHDHVDANYYGGAFEDDVRIALCAILACRPTTPSDICDEVDNQFFAPMQEDLDAWLRDGGLARALVGAAAGEANGVPLDADRLRALAAGLPLADARYEEALS